MTIEALEGLSDRELFDEANLDEAPAEEVAAEPVVEDPPTAETPVAEVSETPVAAAERPAVDDNAPQVPSWRVREINDEKRALADKVAALEAERLQWQQRPAPAPQPSAQVEKPARPDPLLDPDGYAAAIREEIREENLNNRREESLATAHKVYKTEFEEAYAAAQKNVDPALKARMQSSRDPGETLMQWHREQKTRAEVGDDLTAFRQREQERLLSDPAFLAKAIEKARGAAQPSTPAAAKPAFSLPPSLTRATTASADGSADDNDVSDDGLWRHANA